jgi:hypothetical protein
MNMTRLSSIIGLSVFMCVFAHQAALCEPEPIRALPPKGAAEQWVQRDAPKMFTKETLFEHIDGQADLFLQYGFEQSVFATYQNRKDPERTITLDIYDMGDVLHAFGIFSRFRNEDRPGRIGLDSSLGDQYVFFYKGKYFVVVQATGSNSSGLEQLARATDSKISDDSQPPREISYFPKNGLKPGSIEYFSQGLLGHQFLGGGFKATYVEESVENKQGESQRAGRDCHLFLAIFRNSQEAMHSLEQYFEDLSRTGSAQIGTSTQLGPKTFTGTDPYQGKVIVAQKGPFLAGAVGFEKEGQGENKLLELITKIK